MSYDPGYGQQPGSLPSPFAPDPSPVPDVSRPPGGYPPAPPPAGPPAASPAPPPYPAPPPSYPGSPQAPGPQFAGPPSSGPPMPGPPMPGPPLSGPPSSGAPASPPFGAPGPYPVMAQLDRGPRPGTVTAAVALTFAGAALAFVGTVLFHLFWDGWMAAQAAGADLETAEGVDVVAGVMTFLAAGLNLVAAAGAAICGIFALRGSNGARITLCVLTGVYAGWKLMCGGWWMLAGIGASQDPGIPQVRDDVPYLFGAVGIDFLLMILGIATMVLLLVGPSNRYFKPPRPVGPPLY